MNDITAYLIRLHDLLDSLPDLIQSSVNPGALNTHVGGRLGRVHQRVKLRVEMDGPRAVYDPAIDVGTEVYLAYVIVL